MHGRSHRDPRNTSFNSRRSTGNSRSDGRSNYRSDWASSPSEFHGIEFAFGRPEQVPIYLQSMKKLADYAGTKMNNNPFFPAVMRHSRIRGGCQWASCATCGRDSYTLLHEQLSTDSARSQTMQRHWDDLKSIAQQELTLSTFHAVRSLIRLVFITSHLAYYSTMTSLDL